MYPVTRPFLARYSRSRDHFQKLAILVLSVAAFPSTPALAQPSSLTPAQQTELAKHRDEGKAASKANLWDKARDAYKAAWQLKRDWKTAANLGRAEFQLGKHRDAAEHLTYAIREAPPSLAQEAPAEWNVLREMLQRARAKVGALNIAVEPAGAEVQVGGLPVGKAPLQAPVFVEPGQVAIDARAPGYAVGKVSVSAVGGEEESVKLVLAWDKSAERQGGMSRKRQAGFVAAGVGVAGLAVGTVTGIFALIKHHDAWKCGALGCNQSNYDAADAGKKLTAASTVAFALGLAGGGVATWLLWTTWPRKSSVGLTILPGGGGLTVNSSF